MSIFPTKILLAVDGSRESLLAARTAVDLAKNEDSELHVVYVEPVAYARQLPNWEVYDPDVLSRLRQATQEGAQSTLNEQVREVSELGGEVAGAHARVGSPEVVIVELAEEIGAGLIVLGSRGLGGIRRALMGSVSDSVVRHAHCPVLVVRQEGKSSNR